MQFIPYSVIECSVFHAVWRKATLLNAVNIMQHDWMQWIQCSMIKCNGVYAAWHKASWLNAVDSMQHDWMHCILCSMVQCILIECSGFHAASLNAEDSLHFGAMDPDCMQWSLFSEAQCIPLNAVDFMQHCPNHPIECRGFHPASSPAVPSI